MSAFLGVLVVTLIVSGDGATMSEDSVLLPCACAERNLHEEFKWQMESPNKILVLKYNNTTPNVNPSYMGRAKIFLPEHHDNCSVLFTNITVDDQGEYKCIFHKQEEYQSSLVYLNVSEVNEANPDRARYRYLTIIPIMLVLGLSLLLWRRWDAQSSQRTREVGADNFYC
ncbi:hypothetical protein FQN60_001216 [Etheostoma spectabile]|uniref:Immunoglobulin V-set domain-containing protein n=1 Tax=Etheostoma spectabile TaxID=54343 RepID=A0A5J5D051_9PERO|nr:hypothetical protein FQN60_001216 [Etheostoma spectabile]